MIRRAGATIPVINNEPDTLLLQHASLPAMLCRLLLGTVMRAATSRLERGAAVAEGAPVTVQATVKVTSGEVIPIARLIRQPSGGDVMAEGLSDGSVSASLTLAGKQQGNARNR